MTPKTRIGIITCAKHPDLVADDRLFIAALEATGRFEWRARVWDDPAVDWKADDVLLFRSCWDYYLKAPKFLRWLAKLEALGARTLNPLPLIRENLDKSYLLKLERAGVATAPTELAEKTADDAPSLANILKVRGWHDAVVKPAISAGGYQTWRTSAVLAAQETEQKKFARLLRKKSVLVQPFLPEIQSEGEWSLIFIDGEFSHCVLKKAAPREFRIQEKFGGTVISANPEKTLVDAARHALAAVHYDLLYARADFVVSKGSPMLLELELFEPSLYFGHGPQAVAALIAALEKKCIINENLANS